MRNSGQARAGLPLFVRSESPVRIGPDACLPTEAVFSYRLDAGDSRVTWRSVVVPTRRAARPASLQNPQTAGKAQ
jgi:hypothetical protein